MGAKHAEHKWDSAAVEPRYRLVCVCMCVCLHSCVPLCALVCVCKRQCVRKVAALYEKTVRYKGQVKRVAPGPELHHLRCWPKENGRTLSRLVDPRQIRKIRVLIFSYYHEQTAAFFIFFKSLLYLELKFNFLILGERKWKICWGLGWGRVTQESSWTLKDLLMI